MELEIDPIFKKWVLSLFPNAEFYTSPFHGGRLAIVTNEISVTGLRKKPMANLFALATDIILVDGYITLILDKDSTKNFIINTPKEQ